MATKASAAAAPVSKSQSKKELSTNNYLAGVIAISLLALLISGFILKSLVSSIVVNTKVVAGKNTASNDLDDKLIAIPQLIENYEGLGKSQQLIENGLPTNPDLPQIVTIMQYVAGKSSVEVKEIKPAINQQGAVVLKPGEKPAATPTDRPSNYFFDVMVTGQYSQIVAFFQNLELSARPMKVTSVDFSGDSGSMTADITVQTFYQGEADIKDKTEQVK